MSKQKPPTTFVIRLIGSELRPWDVPMRQLTRILNAVQRLIEHTEAEEMDGDEAAEEQVARPASRIQLLGVISASAAYSVAAIDGASALSVIAATGKSLEAPSAAEWDAPSLSASKDISAAAKAIGCTVEIRREAKDGKILATIKPDTSEVISQSAFVAGESSVYGYLQRVGGVETPRCGLRIATQPEKMVICQVGSEELVRELGRCLYTIVRVSGKVTWFRKNWRIKSVYVRSFEPVRSGSIREALDAIREAGGKAWDDVDDPQAVIDGVPEK